MVEPLVLVVERYTFKTREARRSSAESVYEAALMADSLLHKVLFHYLLINLLLKIYILSAIQMFL